MRGGVGFYLWGLTRADIPKMETTSIGYVTCVCVVPSPLRLGVAQCTSDSKPYLSRRAVRGCDQMPSRNLENSQKINLRSQVH